MDANVRGAWADGWTGAGVQIGIVEADRFQSDHADMRANYAREYNLGSSTSSDEHATAVAGIAAARGGNPGVGVTGAAPRASLSYVRGNYGSTDIDATIARAIMHRNDVIDIKNYSFGPADQFEARPQWAQALRDAASSKAIHVQSAGNSSYNANKYGGRNNSNQVVVGAVGSDGKLFSMLQWYRRFRPQLERGEIRRKTTDYIHGGPVGRLRSGHADHRRAVAWHAPRHVLLGPGRAR